MPNSYMGIGSASKHSRGNLEIMFDLDMASLLFYTSFSQLSVTLANAMQIQSVCGLGCCVLVMDDMFKC